MSISLQAMVSVVYWQPTGQALADQFGPEVSSHLSVYCIHHMNWVNDHNALSMITAP